MRTQLSAILMILAAAGPVAAQTATLRGIVVDGSTGKPMIGASVEVRGDGDGGRTSTDRDGRFQLSGVPAGAVVAVSQLGYATWVTQVDTSMFVNVTLDVDPISMEAVEAVADRFRERRRARGIAVRHYDGVRLMSSSAQNARDFARQHASLVPCGTSALECMRRRGRLYPVTVCIDGVNYGRDADALAGIALHDIHVLEVAGATVHVFTKHFAGRLVSSRMQMTPLSGVGNWAC